ncbi:hypothetical protein AGOR_G00207490 [Albula goreensis]|uniref:Uncharacterized protein n=1 Tax=Albula goreensis TaxID=1534307 RepID=A0A8T3CPP7_9TELE|nr:hypothetical protein AGOR_G00207490 [Albula goreensis]
MTFRINDRLMLDYFFQVPYGRGKWKKKYLVLFLLFSVTACAAAQVGGQVEGQRNQSLSCRSDEFKALKGHCCNKCLPGYRKEADCESPKMRTTCSPCPDGHYMDEINHSKNCRPCRVCRHDYFEKQRSPCTEKQNAVCDCIDGYKRIYIDEYTSECQVEENSTTKPDKPENPQHSQLFLLVGVPVAVTVVLIGVIVFLACKNHRSRGPRGTQYTLPENTSEKCLISPSLSPDSIHKEDESPPSKIGVETHQSTQLPDCVPQEIRLSPFIYYLLDLIPASRFKELVRKLGVSEREIERAERDNHTFKEGQFQMLKVWGESGDGVVWGRLSQRLFSEIVSTLLDMGLSSTVDAIEEKYGYAGMCAGTRTF